MASEPASADAPTGPRLLEEARRVGLALAQAAYFGPFGVDAFTYRDRAGALQLQPRSEINARYTMGFAVGFGHSGVGRSSVGHDTKK
jgi:hypothetical protein